MRGNVARLVLLIMLVGGADLTACSSSESHPTSPSDTTHTDTTTPPPPQRATVRVSVTLNAGDSSVARALGLPSDRRLVGTTVVLQRTGSSSQQTATTDSLGVATFSDVLVGSYQASLVRSLTTSERSLLVPSDADVSALGGGTSFTVSSPSTAASLTVDAGRRG